MTTTDILKVLVEASNNLRKYPYDKIMFAINNMSLTDMLVFRIPANIMILRARPNIDKDFSLLEEMAYPPTTNNFGRAHRPGFPMFYGSLRSNPNQDGLDIIATLFTELLGIFRLQINKEGEEKMSIGTWFNKEDLFVIAMIFNDQCLKKNTDLIGLYQWYIDYLKRFEQNIPQIQILKLISNEFAKPSTLTDDDYKISAAFVESILTKKSKYKLDGIVYPSVKTESENFNIALTPECINSRMRLRNVVTTTVYYKDGVVINDYEKEAFLIPGSNHFILKEITSGKEHLGQKKALELLEYHIHNKNKFPS